MSRRLRRLYRWGALLLLFSAHASAQEADSVTRDAARSLGLSGVDAYQAGDYAVASDRLEKAYSLINVPSLGLWSARALAKRNLLVEAANRYYEVAGLQVPVGDAAVQRQAQADASAELEQLRPQIPRLSIVVEGAEPSELTLSIDGQPVPASIVGKPRLVNPGQHRVEARLGAEQSSTTVQALVGQETTATLNFARAPQAVPANRKEAPTSTARTLGWVTLGAGGVGLALGSVMGGLALNKHADIKSSGACVDARCPPAQQNAIDKLDTYRTVSSIGFIAGGALAATGLVLVLTSPTSRRELSAAVVGERIWLTGRF